MGRDRTGDLQIFSLALSQLSYHGSFSPMMGGDLKVAVVYIAKYKKIMLFCQIRWLVQAPLQLPPN